MSEPSTQDLPPVLPNGMPAEAARHYRELGLWTGQTHRDLFDSAISGRPERTAVVDRHRSLTYRELGEGMARAAAVFRAAGVGEGSPVVVQLPNSAVFLETVGALFALGAVPVFALPAHGSREVEHFCALADAVAYVGPRRGPRDLLAVADAVREHRGDVAVVTVDERVAQPWAEATVDGDVVDVRDAAMPTTRVSPASLAFLQLSGGTTALPKLIPRTHDDYLYSVRRSVEVCDVRPEDVMLVALPCAHNFTMSSPGILGALHVGATIVMAADPSPTTCLSAIEKHGVTQAALVPPLLLAWLNSPAVARHDLSSLRTLWVGGAKLSDTAARRVGPELGCTLQQVFGMAEGLVNYTRLDDPEDLVVTTQGRPMSEHDELRILAEDGTPVAPGEPGVLHTRGPYTICQYHRVPEVNARSFSEDGFYCTGDIVRQLPSGHIVVVGRDKDQINRGGEKVAPEAVENELLAHPAVHDVSVVGIPDEALGERICAYLIPRGDHRERMPTAVELRGFLRGRGLSSFAVPDVFEVVSEFPHTGVGKTSKKDQRGMAVPERGPATD